MTTKELQVAGITTAVEFGIIILVGAIGLSLRYNTQTSGGRAGGRRLDLDPGRAWRPNRRCL